MKLPYLLLAAAAVLASYCSIAEAGGPPPFVVQAFAQANGAIPGVDSYADSDSAANVAMAPATASGSLTPVSSFASATFTEFGAQSQNGSSFGINAQAVGGADDTLTVEVAGNPVGTTRLKMMWQVDGMLSVTGNPLANFDSSYRTDTAGDGQPNIFLPTNFFSSNGSVSTLVTFEYENVPLGSPWNLRTQLSTSVTSGPGVADFASTATFVGASLLINDSPVSATITGASGAVYAIPEPASAALLAVGGLALLWRGRRV